MITIPAIPTEIKNIADKHDYCRTYSCFQMGPELALKFAGFLSENDYPYQEHLGFDMKGFEPYAAPFETKTYFIHWCSGKFEFPYSGMNEVFRTELAAGRFPIVSLKNPAGWHAHVVVDSIGDDDFLVVTRTGTLESPPCITLVDSLRNKIENREKVDYLIWKAKEKQPDRNFPTA